MRTLLTNIISLLVLVLGLGLYQGQLTDSENYVYSKTHLSAPGDTTQKTVETVTYFDGLGRSKQTIVVNGGGTANTDLVTPVIYDGFGRQVLDVLPVPVSTSNKAFQDGLNENSGSGFYGARPYAEKVLENSPLDRIQQQIQPGSDWQSHPVKFDYQTNSSSDVLKFTTVTGTQNGAFSTGTLKVENYYVASTLYKNKISDEDGNTTYEFKNGEGQTLLIRKVSGNATEVAEQSQTLAPQPVTQYLDTYYVYNEYNQLVFEIPPLASAEFRANPNQTISNPDTNDIINNLCYQYRRDGRNRLVEKKLPGKGWEYMVYDKADRLIMTQDAEMRKPENGTKWLITKYDDFGRILYTGFISGGDRANMQGQAGNLVITEKPDERGFAMSGLQVYYSNDYFYQMDTVLSVNYYDSYPTDTPFPDQNKIYNVPILTSTYDNLSRSIKSLPLATFVKNISDDSWTKTYTFYDGKARAIGTHSINYLGGSTIVYSELDFSGVPKKTETWHKRINTEIPVHIVENFDYDHQNRLKKHYHEVIGKTDKVLLAENIYDEIGRLKIKKTGAVADGSFNEVSPAIQTIGYSYNIRSWMTGINLNSSGAADNSKLFSYQIRYNDPLNNTLKKYNGNIAEVDWTYQDEDTQRYEYSYDNLNRLKRANYKSIGQTTTTDSKFYNEQLTYDLNGNILTLKRNARPNTGQTAVQVDDLTYTYENNSLSNRLSTIYDNSQNSRGYPAVMIPAAVTYDSNGNMLTMPDKGITDNMVYNYLNLPEQIIQNGNPITYTYRTDGVKVHKLFTINGQDIDTDYLDGFVYTTPYTNELEMALQDNPEAALAGQQEALELSQRVINPCHGCQAQQESTPNFFPTAEGFYDYENLRYIYQYKDQIGNVRLSYVKDPETGDAVAESTNDYYPFGLNFINITPRITGISLFNPSVTYENWKMQGQELQETGFYQYKWRQYMPDVGRFFNIDPLAEKYPYNSTYAFSENRVTDGRELEGLEVVLVKDSQKNQSIVKTANNGNYADNAKTKTVHVFAHGNPSAFYNENVTPAQKKAGLGTINSGAKLNNVLNQGSELWKNSESKDGFTVVIHSCRTGRTTIDKAGNVKESVAEKISGSKEMQGVTVVAPDERDYFSANGTEIGPRETTNTNNNGDPLPGKEHDDLKGTETEGNWNVFNNGDRTSQYDGSWEPKANPGFIDNLLHKN